VEGARHERHVARLEESTIRIKLILSYWNPKTTMGTTSKSLSAKEYQAIGVLTQHPDWTNEQIAEEIGVHRGSLYRMKEFLKLRARIRAIGRQELPHGTKVVNQDDPRASNGLEAWDNEPDDES
jgi:hypothetical protein